MASTHDGRRAFSLWYGAELSGPEVLRWRTQLRVRFVVIVAIGVIFLVRHRDIGSILPALGCLVILVPLSIVSMARLPRNRRFDLVLGYADSLVAGAAVLVAPQFIDIIVLAMVAALGVAAVHAPRVNLLIGAAIGTAFVAYGKAAGLVDRPTWVLLTYAALVYGSLIQILAVAESHRKVEGRYRMVVEGVGLATWEQDPFHPGDLLLSGAARRIFPDAAEGRVSLVDFAGRIHPEDLPFLPIHRLGAVDGPRPGTVDVRIRVGAEWRSVESRLHAVRDHQDRIIHWAGTLEDRTEEVRSRRRLAQYGLIVEQSPTPNVVVDVSDPRRPTVQRANPAAARWWAERRGEHDPVDIEGLELDRLRHGFAVVARELLERVDRAEEAVASAGAAGGVAEQRVDDPVDGRTYTVRMFRLDPARAVLWLEDITAAVAAESELRRRAKEDDLTGLPNRTALREVLSERLGSLHPRPTAVLFLDLDGFKEVNDGLGHAVGDIVLRHVARRIDHAVVQADGHLFAARIGGDEFAVVVDEIQGRPAEVVAEELADAIRRPVLDGGQRIDVGVSIGVARGPADGATPEALLAAADHAMYRAKRGGVDVVVGDVPTGASPPLPPLTFTAHDSGGTWLVP